MENQNEKLTIPGAIVVAGVIIALALLYTGGKRAAPTPATPSANTTDQNKAGQLKLASNVKPITSADHILGNPNAPVKIIEFSDIQCPFCRQYHPVLTQIMNEYGKQGKVAWVYRHFPLVSIHPLAEPAAIASECVFEQGGNDQFWEYINKLFADGLTNTAQLSDTARSIGVNMAQFSACTQATTGKANDVVQADIADGLNSGVSGTPYSIIIGKDGKVFAPLSGAAQYPQVKALIDAALAQ